MRSPACRKRLSRGCGVLHRHGRCRRKHVGGGWLTDAVKAKYREVWRTGCEGALNYYRASPLHPPTRRAISRVMALELPPRIGDRASPDAGDLGRSRHRAATGLLDGLEAFVPHMRLVQRARSDALDRARKAWAGRSRDRARFAREARRSARPVARRRVILAIRAAFRYRPRCRLRVAWRCCRAASTRPHASARGDRQIGCETTKHATVRARRMRGFQRPGRPG